MSESIQREKTTYTIIILEDSIEVVSALVAQLNLLKQEISNKGINLCITIMQQRATADRYFKLNPLLPFGHLVLYDPECLASRSLNILEPMEFEEGTISSFSANPMWNNRTKKKNDERKITMVLSELDDIAKKAIQHIRRFIMKQENNEDDLVLISAGLYKTHRSITPAQLREILGISYSYATYLLQKMEKEFGLVGPEREDGAREVYKPKWKYRLRYF